jgi:hypothetical protein
VPISHHGALSKALCGSRGQRERLLIYHKFLWQEVEVRKTQEEGKPLEIMQLKLHQGQPLVSKGTAKIAMDCW